ncbi:cadherin EGF LAG seven-pass G-type receptor 2 [Elysia marginata]|uniref:Cadherin EGF LAG seven-pass G-type receptor 2 n=1 Tax=Elysia marginata TaxID=1093978 RepID=A0AAV4I9Q3_9GAST|nr:cadherin EGF LAG seven-pass G-type receptor 2 [Elysia marginata]
MFSLKKNVLLSLYINDDQASQADKPSERYSIAVVVINVTDVNNHAPVMGSRAYNVSITEGVRPGFTLLTVTAKDEDLGDNAVFHFDLDDSSNTFEVVTKGTQGEIHLILPVDREAQEIYVFQVRHKAKLSYTC